MANPPRIMLFHALRASEAPAHQAMSAVWPEARYDNVIDDSLTLDLEAAGGVTDAIIRRFEAIGHYAELVGVDGLLFTCSAFGPAIQSVQQSLSIPVLRPNEAAFEAALDCGDRIALMVTFGRAFNTMKVELEAMARARGREISVIQCVADGALSALQDGRPDEHDALAAKAAERVIEADAIILGQFSLARAKPTVRQVTGIPVFTTPETAVEKMRDLVRQRYAGHTKP